MSTLKADAVTTKSDNTDLTITGGGTGVPNLEAGFKVGGTVGVPISGLQVGTDGELITWDASGDPAAVAVGTATHVLTSNGAGAAPTFQAAGGGGAWTPVSTGTLSSASELQVTDISKQTRIIINLTSQSGNQLRLRTSTNNGSSYDSGASDYAWSYYKILNNLAGFSTETAEAEIFLGWLGGMTTIDILYPEDASHDTLVGFQHVWGSSSTDFAHLIGTGAVATAAANDAVRIYPSVGTMSGSYIVLNLSS